MAKTAAKQFVRTSVAHGNVTDFISEGFSEIEEVGNEFREMYDNAPDNLKGTSVNEARDSTASEIEGLSEPYVNSEILGSLDCIASIDNGKVYRGRQAQSRACRASNGAAKLRAAADAINAWLEENDELPDADTNDAESMKARAEKIEEIELKGYTVEDYETAREEAESLASDCEEIADAVEGLEYPGMFG